MAFTPPTLRELRHHIMVQQLGAKTPDGMGGYTTSWEDVIDLWARFTVWKGGEMLRLNQPASSVLFEVATRFRPGIVPAMRLLEIEGDKAGRWYNIRFVSDPDQRARWLQMTVEAQRQP